MVYICSRVAPLAPLAAIDSAHDALSGDRQKLSLPFSSLYVCANNFSENLFTSLAVSRSLSVSCVVGYVPCVTVPHDINAAAIAIMQNTFFIF